MIIILSIALIIVVAFVAWFGYKRMMIVRNRLHMNLVLTNISHELLTPLTVISASIEHLREQEPRYATDYALMELNVERVTHLLQEILETSKSQAGELKLQVSQGDVMEYIRQTALCIEPLIYKNGLEFELDCSPQSMMGWIDTDKNLAVSVQDTGIGIPHSRIKNLFQRYYDGDYRWMQVNGTGLGLALTRDLVYLHNGTIDCKSEEGKGTVFTISLPISKDAYNAAQIDEKHAIDPTMTHRTIIDIHTLEQLPEQLEVPTLKTRDESFYNLLIVEDNQELLMLLNTLLCSKYNVLTATNGRQALELIENNDVDLVVSDVVMPEMDGNELTRRIKSSETWNFLPVILISSQTSEEARKESMLIGADDFITKPFRLGDLELRINNIIENRKRIVGERNASASKEEDRPLTADEEFLLRARECVRKHLSNSDFDRETFASEMGASSSTLYNKLRALTGMNISNFIRDIRMNEAKRLAESQPDIRVSDLAYMVGFKDPKYFATCFKKDFGIQPSELMNRAQEKSAAR